MNNNILLVDDDPSIIRVLARILDGLGPMRFATSGAEALRLAGESAPDLILLDAEMPGMSGFQVCEALKADAGLADVPVIFITSHGEPDFEVAGFEIGAADFIAKPVRPALVIARVKAQLRVKQLADDLRRISTIDALTGVANRLLRRRSGARVAPCQAQRRALVAADRRRRSLQAVQRPLRPPAGDACLRSVAAALATASKRSADLVARYGGEEFVLLMPGTPRAGAEHMAHRVLDAVEALQIPHAASPTAQHVTVSLGVACYDEDSACWIPASRESRFHNETQPSTNFGELVKAADVALYAAKHGGRAQARLLDVADAEVPALVRDLAAASRTRRRRRTPA